MSVFVDVTRSVGRYVQVQKKSLGVGVVEDILDTWFITDTKECIAIDLINLAEIGQLG